MFKDKLLMGLFSRIINLLDESEDIYFRERPYLLDPDIKPETIEIEDRLQNDLDFDKTVKAFSRQVDKYSPKGEDLTNLLR